MTSNFFNSSHRINGIQTPIIAVIADLIRNSPGTISLGQGVVYFKPPQSALERLHK